MSNEQRGFLCNLSGRLSIHEFDGLVLHIFRFDMPLPDFLNLDERIWNGSIPTASRTSLATEDLSRITDLISTNE